MNIEFIITVFGILFFKAFWIFTDPRKSIGIFDDFLKNKKQRNLTLFQILTIIPTYIVYIFSNQFSLNFNQTIVNIGLILFITGILFTVWAKVVMGKNWNHPIEHNIERQSEIVKDGPFRFSRNPIYVGIIIFIAGFFIALKSPFLVSLPILLFIISQIIKKEEINLEKLFGGEYTEYKKQVPRYLLF